MDVNSRFARSGREQKGSSMKRTKLFAGLAVSGLLGLTSLYAQQTARRLPADDTFVTRAAEGGMAEVELGNLAQQHAASDAVKQFGKRMVDDHTKANNELKQIAAKNNIQLPSDMGAKNRATMDRLSKLNGAEFDRAYMHDMVMDHRTDVNEFRHEADNGKNADVKAFAAKTLPTLEDHLKQAEQVDSQVKK